MYQRLAITWFPPPHREISIALSAKDLGAAVVERDRSATYAEKETMSRRLSTLHRLSKSAERISQLLPQQRSSVSHEAAAHINVQDAGAGNMPSVAVQPLSTRTTQASARFGPPEASEASEDPKAGVRRSIFSWLSREQEGMWV